MSENTIRRNNDTLAPEWKVKVERLAYLLAKLPEQEQEKIYYMLMGAEIFGKSAVASNSQNAV